MQKVINAIALLSGLVSLSVLGGSFYLYKNAGVMIEDAREQVIEEIAEALPKIVKEMMPNIPEIPTSTGEVIPSTPSLTGPAIPFGQ